ncbi:isochorismate synthase [Thermosporothrix hazakensis]|jgi:isochorismate synthase|uniref:isochorismate synthase n=2 Tax=Thermosporothrix TaxID=768650 RepID=A0A326UDX6_THEHA|nr:isochorismate synthase [Thermosporothrix hazakensis]PZW36486.1 isochorismate synthase [Thermosporothrix hazakensis]BBH88955.1 isochorismate synthase [Thermosporothrix sp. COM3]GCE47140.1 isochorismate synthase [Thermosporothrix hazakensis]
METVFTDIPAMSESETGEDGLSQHVVERLFFLCQEASARASHLQQSVLACFTLSVKRYDPLHVFYAFRRMEMGERFFWEVPATGQALIGVGSAVTINAQGANRFDDAAEAVRFYQDHALVAGDEYSPLFFGGFRFDPQRPPTELWHGFPEGLLILPRFLYQCHPGREQATLTLHMLIEPETAIEPLSTLFIEQLRRFNAIVASIPVHRFLQANDEVTPLRISNVLPPQEWMGIVAKAVEKMQRGEYQKVVLARAVEASRELPFDIEATLARLRVNYPNTFVFAIQRGNKYFVGATPERLARAHNGLIETMALASSAPRGKTEAEDRMFERELERPKTMHEHLIVVDMIRSALEQICSEVTVDKKPQLLKLKNIQHLHTHIAGRLLPGCYVLDVMKDLHPTPAVGGFPREKALEEIRLHEKLDRGWYAGPIGWVDGNGNGEFAVALRSALIDGQKATLFVGNGMVADSDPESEFRETCLKTPVMLRGLGGECE